MKIKVLTVCLLIPCCCFSQVRTEEYGTVEVEAEHFTIAEKDEIRKWYVIDSQTALLYKDVDTLQCSGAGGNTFIAVLPDTRRTHGDKLVAGENFSNEPGEMAVVSYNVRFTSAGRYYVWVKAFSTGTEDNGIHVGLNGKWPESGRRMQWCEGKNQWTWASKQRTEVNHCGEEKLIYLDVPSPGNHVISFSMREDGFRFDKFVLSKKWQVPED